MNERAKETRFFHVSSDKASKVLRSEPHLPVVYRKYSNFFYILICIWTLPTQHRTMFIALIIISAINVSPCKSIDSNSFVKSRCVAFFYNYSWKMISLVMTRQSNSLETSQRVEKHSSYLLSRECQKIR